jgi:hypothetical protein
MDMSALLSRLILPDAIEVGTAAGVMASDKHVAAQGDIIG